MPLLVLVGIEGEACEGFVHLFVHSFHNNDMMGPSDSQFSKNQDLPELTYSCPIWYVKTNVQHQVLQTVLYMSCGMQCVLCDSWGDGDCSEHAGGTRIKEG